MERIKLSGEMNGELNVAALPHDEFMTPDEAEKVNTPQAWNVGDECAVHAMGCWYAGRIVKIGRTRVTVRYTSGAGVTRDKAVNIDYIAPVGSKRIGVRS